MPPTSRKDNKIIKIDSIFVDIIELVSMGQFSDKASRPSILGRAITKNDTLKHLLYVLFELNGLKEENFLEIAQKTEEIGRMLYGWKNK